MKSQAAINPKRKLIKEIHKSKFGYEFDLYDDSWVVDGSNTINFHRLRPIDDITEIGFRKTLCRYAEELSPYTAMGMMASFNQYLDAAGATSVNLNGLTNYRASLDKDNEHKLGKLKAFLLAWHDWGFKGVNKDCVNFLEEITLRGFDKGNSVRSACPYSGPLTNNEFEALLQWATNAYTEDKLNLKEYSYFMALAMTGRRSVQIRSLRGGDLIAREDRKGIEHFVNCPRAKQSRASFRSVATLLSINEDLYKLFKIQWEQSVAYVESAVGERLNDKLKKDVPIFLEEKRVSKQATLKSYLEECRAKPDFFHMSLKNAMELLKRVSQKNTARSERTGEFINFTSRRFRYTLGTNLSRRGIGGVGLAAALDHTDTQHIGVYTQNTEEVAEQINEIMAPMLAPLAQAFAGKLIDSEKDAIRANDPHSRIRNGKASNVGNCGTHSFCRDGYRACYTCNHFQPWRDAPHEEVLQEVLEERKHQEEMGVSKYVIQASDRLLLAVQNVIQRCKAVKEAIKLKLEAL